MKIWRSCSSLVVAVLALSSCNYERNKNIEDPAVTKSSSAFAVIQKNIIEPKCLNCHSSNNPSDGIDLSSYANVISSRTVVPGKPELSTLYTSVATKKMPRGGSALADGEIELIQKWILAGALEVDLEVGTSPTPTPTPTPTPEVVPASYQWIHKNIIQRKCLVCHNTAKPRGRVDLSSYEALMASTGNQTKPVIVGDAEGSTFYKELVEKKMPPTIKKLDAAETKALHDWIAAGALPPPPPPAIIPSPTPGPVVPEPNYGWLAKNVLARRCGSCHGIPFKVAQIDFTSYDTLMASPGKTGKPVMAGDPEHSTIYNVVVSGNMPPERKAMTIDEIRIVKQWIEEGAKNN